ncbi:MAG: mechanosensitive ion channel domain-containing protein, partial [Nitrospinota bacterium]
MEGLSKTELAELINLLENEKEREKFLERLRLLQKSRQTRAEVSPKAPTEAPQEVEAPFQLGQLRRRASEASDRARVLLVQFFQLPRLARSYFSKPENLARLGTILAKLAFAFVISGILFALLRRFVRPIRPDIDESAILRPRDKVRLALANFAIKTIPYLALVLFGYLSTQLIGLPGTINKIILVILIALLIQRAIIYFARAILAPVSEKLRLVPCSDMTANYSFIWCRRLASYFIFLYAFLLCLQIASAPSSLIYTLRIAIGFIGCLLVIVLFFQQKETLHQRLSARPREPAALGNSLIRIYNSVLSKWHYVASGYLLLIFGLSSSGRPGGVSYVLFSTLWSVVAIVAGAYLVRVVGWLFRYLFAINDVVKRRLPGLEAKTNRYISILHTAARFVCYVLVFSVVGEIWGIDISAVMTSPLGSMLIGRALAIAITVGVAYVILGITQYVVDYMTATRTDAAGNVIEPGKKRKTLVPLVGKVIRAGTIFISAIIVLGQLGVNTTPILAGVGILGLAVGFGAQTLVKDIINGLFILFEDSVSVGDVIVIKGTGGLVESVNIRTIRMRDLAGNVHVIPNSQIDMITNMTKDFSRYVLDIGVAYREDVDEVIEVLKEIGDEMLKDPDFGPDMLEPLEILGVDKFADSAVIIKARLITKPI